MNNSKYSLDEESELDEENEVGGSHFKITSKDLNLFKEERSISTLLNWLERGKLIVPKFQRNPVWNERFESYFIESILFGMPVPSIILFKFNNKGLDEDDTYEVIDGQQRLLSFINFKEMKLSDIKGISNKSSNKWSKKSKKYKDISDNEKYRFDDYLINISVFSTSENLSHENKMRYKYDIFRRINTGSIRLTPQEIRNAVYNGEYLDKISDASETDWFMNLIKNDKKYLWNRKGNRKAQDEFIIRCLAYSFFYNNTEIEFFSSSKEDYLNNYMENVNNKKIDLEWEILNMESVFKKIYKISNSSFYSIRRDNIDIVTNSISETFSEALFIYVKNKAEKGELNEQKIKEKINNVKRVIFLDKEKYRFFFQSTVSKHAIVGRVEILEKLFASDSK
ncbi:MAG: DUF262 domain-containing protein [Mycoplasmoidaceae bacterium]